MAFWLLLAPAAIATSVESKVKYAVDVTAEPVNPSIVSIDRQVFIDAVACFVRKIADGTSRPRNFRTKAAAGSWDITVSLWYQGKNRGRGNAHNDSLYPGLRRATIEAINSSGLERDKLKDARFVVALPCQECVVLEHNGTGRELVDGMVAVYRFDKQGLRHAILLAKEYLLRILDNKLHGAHKFYYPKTDACSGRLYTLYTSSLVSTLIHIRKIDPDPRIERQIRLCGDYILSMQYKENPKDRSYGAFYYSYDPETQRRTPLFVVGTTSKTIVTLLEMHALTGDTRYLVSAKSAAHWLLTMQQPDGTMKSYIRLSSKGAWHASRRFSLLYNGQALSALSHMYMTTKDRKYFDAADRIARNIQMRVPADGSYMSDDYRGPNPISSSWAVMSLHDFHKASGDEHCGKIVDSYSRALLKHQIQDTEDLSRFGRWQGSLSSSGNGWLSELMSKLFADCMKSQRAGCEKYRESVIKAARWIMQHIYDDENMYRTTNPEMARGGIFWSRRHAYVRTDSVCHAANGFVTLWIHLGEEEAIAVPQKTIARMQQHTYRYYSPYWD